jgi:hypothetical protein
MLHALLHGDRSVTMAKRQPDTGCLPGIVVRALLLCMAIGLFSPPSGAASAEAEPGLVAAVVRGMEARENLASSVVRSLKGLWIADEEDRIGPPVLSDGPSRNGPATWLIPGERIPESTQRIYVAVSGERYRETVRYLRPEGRAVTSKGYDGRVGWLWDGGHMGTTRRRTLASTSAGKFTGLAHVVAPQAEVRLSWRIKEGRPQLVGEEEVLGHRCYVLHYGSPGPDWDAEPREASMTCYIAPALGYAVVRWERRWTPTGETDAAGLVRRSYSDFREVSEGFWLPFVYEKTGESRQAGGSWALLTRLRATADYVKINVSIPDSEFSGPP